MKTVFGRNGSRNAKGLAVVGRKGKAAWGCDAPNGKIILATLGMTVVLAATAVSALFIFPRSGQWSAQVIDPAMAAETPAAAAQPSQEISFTTQGDATPRQARVEAGETAKTPAVDPLKKADPRFAEEKTAGNATRQPPAIMTGGGATSAALPSVAASLLPTDSLRKRVVPDSQIAAADTTKTSAVPAKVEDKPAPAEVQAKTAPEKPVQQASASGAGGNATIKSSVNMRAAPQKGAKVLGVVPRNASVQLNTCSQWCEIEYNGQKGYVYKSYIR